jgi:hypothetical protein
MVETPADTRSIDNKKLIVGLYAALQSQNAAAMRACYHADAHFSDPVFPNLYGVEVGDMWQMLCERANGIRVEVTDIQTTERNGTAYWQAWYPFSGTGRQVHNQIRASYEFRGGQIIRHVDSFDLWRWARQALGIKGLLLGWLPPVLEKIRAQAAASLQQWQRSR